MDRNRITQSIARRVSDAITTTGTDLPTVAQAADITTLDLLDRLNGVVEFQVRELVNVGGFLRIPVTQFLEGAA